VAPALAPSSPFRSSPELLALRDPRPRGTARSVSIIMEEIQQIEPVFNVTSKKARERWVYDLPLARLYTELAGTAAADRDAAGSSSERQEEAKKAESIRRAAQDAAARHYARLAETNPGWCARRPDHPRPSEECSNGAWYFAGYAYEAAGQLDKARFAYLRVIQSRPDGHFVPYAYLAFGELFGAEAASDPSKWALARQSFAEVLRFPPPDNLLYGYALLRMGEIHRQLGERAEVHAAFENLRERARAGESVAEQIAARLIPEGE
jgi:tetratricopeptide (TPR) repeat protein